MSKDKFEWNDELVLKFARFTNCESTTFQGRYADLEQFKKEQLSKRDWEILKLRIGNTDYLVDADKSDGSAREYHIHSVRRLSDGEIFSIGDKLHDMDGDDVIDAFWLDYQGNEVWISTNQRKKYGCSLDVAEKAKKKVLFTTEDGVEIFEGDKRWFHTLFEDFTFNINCDLKQVEKEVGFGAKIWFSEIRMKEYILMNKPMLSLEDLFFVWGDNFNRTEKDDSYKESVLFLKFKQLAKDKLNKK